MRPRSSSDYKASIDIGYKLTNRGDAARLSTLELKPFKQRFSVSPVLRVRYSEGQFSIDQSEVRKSDEERFVDLLKKNSGIMKSDFESLAANEHLGRNRARAFVDASVKAGTVKVNIGSKNRQFLVWIGALISPPAHC